MRLRNVITTLRHNNFLKMNVVFFVGSLLVAFFNYLYYPVLGRMLSTEQFGELQVLVSLFIQATIFLNVMALVSVNIMTRKETEGSADVTLRELEKIALLLAVILLVVMVVTAPALARVFQFADSSGFIAIAAVFAVSVPLAFRSAYLRGKSDFVSTSVGAVLGSAIKIVLSVVLVYVGWETLGAVVGILLAQGVALLYATHRAMKRGFVRQGVGLTPIRWSLVRPEIPFIVFVFYVSFVVTLLFSIDVALVKYFFPPEQAGAYAGMSTVARIVYFLTVSISVVLLSAIKPGGDSQKNMRLLGKSLAMTAGIGGAAALVFVIFPEPVVHVLMGSKFDEYVHLLPLLALTMLATSIANVLTNYHMAMRDYAVAYVVSIAAIFTILLTFFRHGSIEVIVQNLFFGSVVLCVLLMLKTGLRVRQSV